MTAQYLLDFGTAAFTLLAQVGGRVVILVAVAGVVLAILRPARAALQHGAWSAVLWGTLLLIPAGLLPALFDIPAATSWITASASPSQSPFSPGANSVQNSSPGPVAQVDGKPNYLGIAALLSLLITAILLLRYAVLSSLVRRRLAQAEPLDSPIARELSADLGLKSVPKLVTSDRLPSPAVFGGARPIVVLPSEWALWGRDKLRSVLAHEFAHIARGDGYVLALSNLAAALLWFHPAAHWLRSKIRFLAESACDDHAVLVSGSPANYAQALLEVASGRSRPQASPVLSAMARDPKVSRRIERILAITAPQSGSLARPVRRRLVVAAASLSFALSLVSVGLAQSQGVTLSGSVEDKSGARIPNAVILVIERAQGVTEAVRSGADGAFRIEGLPPSQSYEVEVRVKGFATKTQVIPIISDLTHEVILDIDSVREEIVVSGAGPRTPPAVSSTPRRHVRVGGAVESAKLVAYVAPEYPSSAEQEGVEGTVLLEAVISPEGLPGDIRTLNTLIDSRLAKAAEDAFRQWRYKAVQLNGKPVEALVAVSIVFELP